MNPEIVKKIKAITNTREFQELRAACDTNTPDSMKNYFEHLTKHEVLEKTTTNGEDRYQKTEFGELYFQYVVNNEQLLNLDRDAVITEIMKQMAVWEMDHNGPLFQRVIKNLEAKSDYEIIRIHQVFCL